MNSARITDKGVRRGTGPEHMRASAAWNARHWAGALVVFSLLGVGCSEAPPPAHCQDEVMAAFKRLEAPGLPYRKETVRVYNGQAEFRMTYEFLPPDRRRYVNHPSDPHYESETIEIGERTWARFPRQHEGWSEVKAKDVLSLDAPKDEPFACLGPVEFNGKTYLGYRRRAAMSFVRDVLRPQGEKAWQEDLAAVRDGRMPQPWRTVLLDASSLLPAYDLLAQENQFDSPSMSTEHYTYPDDIRIEAPFQ
jgi:hypothetical protein